MAASPNAVETKQPVRTEDLRNLEDFDNSYLLGSFQLGWGLSQGEETVNLQLMSNKCVIHAIKMY